MFAALKKHASFLVVILLVWPATGHASLFNNSWQSDLTVSTFADSVTGAPSRYTPGVGWTIEPGADNFFGELYERPTSQGFHPIGGAPAFDVYHQALDIVSGRFALDQVNGHAYFSIDLNGQDELKADGGSSTVGFKHFYRVRLSGNDDFFGGHMLGVKDPDGNSVGNTFNGSDNFKSTQMWIDDDAPWVTGTGVANTGEGTLGYDELTSEGSSNRIQSRIVGDSVELALDYRHFGLSADDFSYMIFEATQGLTDPQNYFWNDEYNFSQAGSPYDPGSPPQNIYELDTLWGGWAPPNPVIPEPSALLVWGGLAGCGLIARRRRGL